jgi:hypothetical protein
MKTGLETVPNVWKSPFYTRHIKTGSHLVSLAFEAWCPSCGGMSDIEEETGGAQFKAALLWKNRVLSYRSHVPRGWLLANAIFILSPRRFISMRPVGTAGSTATMNSLGHLPAICFRFWGGCDVSPLQATTPDTASVPQASGERVNTKGTGRCQW